MDMACENARAREWCDGEGYSRLNMSPWESAPPAGERQYLTKQQRERQCLNHEEEAAMWAHNNSHRQNSQMEFRGHGAQETQPPPLYHQDHYRMAQCQNIRDWPNLYGPLRGQATPNVTLHHSGEKHERHFPSCEFLPPLIVERGHEDIFHHHNTDRDYMVGRRVNHNNLHYLERGCSRGVSSVRSSGVSSVRSSGVSSVRSSGVSSVRSSGVSSVRSRGVSSVRSRGVSSVRSSGVSSVRSSGVSSVRSRGVSSVRSSGVSSVRSRGVSSVRSRGVSSVRSSGVSSVRSSGVSSVRSKGGSSRRSRGVSSVRSSGVSSVHSSGVSSVRSRGVSSVHSRGVSSVRSSGVSSVRSRGVSSVRSSGVSSVRSSGVSSVHSKGGSSRRSSGVSSVRSRGVSSVRSSGVSSVRSSGVSSVRSKGGSSRRSSGVSSVRSRGVSSVRSSGVSSVRSSGVSSVRSKGGSSRRSSGVSSVRSRGCSSRQSRGVNPSQTTTNSSSDIQNANITPTVPVVNNKHSETTSGRRAGPVRDFMQALTTTAQQWVSMDYPSTGGTESGVIDLTAQVTNADTHGILGPSIPSQAITQQTGNAALVSHTQTSATPEQQHAPSPSPKPLTETPQDNMDMDILQAGKMHRHLNTKDTNQSRPPERSSAEDSTVWLEIKSIPRSIPSLPPVAIIPPIGPQQSPEPMETENADNEVPFKILNTWSINKQQVECMWERAKYDASSLSVLNETVQVESVMDYDKPVDASATSSLASTGEDNDEVLQVNPQMDKSSPSPFVHTNPQATDIVHISGAQTIVEGNSNGTDERTLDLSTVTEVQLKLRVLQQLVNYLENAATITEEKDGCLEAILEQYWSGDTSNLVEALKDQRDKKIMQDASAWATEDEKAVVIFAVRGISLGEVVKTFPITAQFDSSSQVGYRSSWLNVNENDIDKESGRAWSLRFIPDKAEESSKVVGGGVNMDDTFQSKMETVDLPARQPVEAEAEATDSDLATNTDLMMDADPPTDADSETEALSPMILTVLTSEDAVRLLAETEAPDADLTTDSNCPTDANCPTDLKTVTDLTTDSDTDPLSPMNLTILTSEDAMRLFCQIENGSDLHLGFPEPCSENKDKTETKQLENIESGSLDKSCYCPCIIETDNGFESVLRSSCQREKGLQQGSRCITISHCFTLSDTSDTSDQEAEEVSKDSGGKATVDNQFRDKKQIRSTEEEGDDNQSSVNKMEGEMQQCTGFIPIPDFFSLLDTSEDSDQETEDIPDEQHAQIEAHASNVLRKEPETDARAHCAPAQEHTTQSKVSHGSEDRERPQEKDQDCRTRTSHSNNWCSPIEDCGSPVGMFDKVADFVNHYKKMEKEKTLHPTSSDRQKPKKSRGRAERGRSPSQPRKSSGVKTTVNNQPRDKKPHASHKRRHSTESDEIRCKDRGSSTEKEREGSQSRDKKGRPSIEKVGEGSQSRDKTSQKRRNSTETEGRNSGDSKELQCQLVERERGSRNSPPCPGVKTLHVQGSSTTTVPLKFSINVPKKPSTNVSPSKHTEGVPKMTKIKALNKTSRHRSPEKSVSPVVKERQRNGGKQKPNIQCLKGFPPSRKREEGSPPRQKREEGSPPRKKMVEDRGEPGGKGVKNPDSSKKLKRKAESDLTSQQNLTKIPKGLNRNEKGRFSKSDSPTLKPRIPKLPRTPEVSKDGNERENREETSLSASRESQMLNKSARVAHKPKSFIKPASPNSYSPGILACPNLDRVSPPHGNRQFGAEVSARQQVFSDWKSRFVPTPTPRTRRLSGCPPEEVEGPQSSSRIIRSILKRVDAPPKPKRNISFPLNPKKVHYFEICEYENYTDPEDAHCSDDEGELKPGPSGACEKSFKRKREMLEPAAILMKKSIAQAKHWTRSLHREPPKDSRLSGNDTNQENGSSLTGYSQNASPPHRNHPGYSQNASPPHRNHPGYSQNASPPHRHHPGSKPPSWSPFILQPREKS